MDGVEVAQAEVCAGGTCPDCDWPDELTCGSCGRDHRVREERACPGCEQPCADLVDLDGAQRCARCVLEALTQARAQALGEGAMWRMRFGVMSGGMGRMAARLIEADMQASRQALEAGPLKGLAAKVRTRLAELEHELHTEGERGLPLGPDDRVVPIDWMRERLALLRLVVTPTTGEGLS